ncbi:MAG: NADH-quinone oxidoreductase subunit L [Myxococcaceae bacterium]|nr:NADH-quinone oxidoreductase subunit L [Myxococcaceae bacterium]
MTTLAGLDVSSIFAWAVPAVLAAGAAIQRPHTSRIAGLAGLLALGAAGFAATAGSGAAFWHARLDLVGCVMLLLVCGLGWVTARYSRNYLDGDPRHARYSRWLLATLSAVTALVVSNDLGIIVVAWTATGLALHQLLTLYPERTAALVAAHKKFIVSRLADACLWVSLGLVYRDVGSSNLDRIALWAQAHPALSPGMHAAAALLVVAVALKSAQLPFHGWLMQVMEAPTPVSALLHAGVVNIGGFVMLRLAGWLTQAEPARYLLLAVGLTTAFIASLVVTTRVSAKVGLAWSTCAQMGFMLMQCALGLWHLALLHLAAHSLYKAHAFLSAGAAVEQWRVRTLVSHVAPPPKHVAAAAALAASGLGGALWLAGAPASLTVFAVLAALAAAPLLARVNLASRGIAVIAAYVVLHLAAARALPAGATPHPVALALVGLGFAALFSLKTSLALRPEGRLARALYPRLFAGLHLDELFTRLTFRVWPPRLPARQTPAPLSTPKPAEA